MTAKKAAGSANKGGRPTKYTDALADKIIELIRTGVSEYEIGQMPDMPSARTISRWKDSNKEFCLRSACAREASAEVFDQKRREAARWLMTQATQRAQTGEDFPKGVVEAVKAVMQEHARSAALRDDSRFGDRKKVALTGHDGGAVKVEEKLDLSGASLDALMKARELLYGAAKATDSD